MAVVAIVGQYRLADQCFSFSVGVEVDSDEKVIESNGTVTPSPILDSSAHSALCSERASERTMPTDETNKQSWPRVDASRC